MGSGVVVEVFHGQRRVSHRERGLVVCIQAKPGAMHFGFELPIGCGHGCCLKYRCWKHGIWTQRRAGFPRRHA